VKRDPAAVSRFVETFASAFVDAGVPRMPSRVFAAILADDAGRLTAAELAERLQASPAAISGAVRYLIQVGLIAREREPGSRRDIYAVGDDAWYEAIVRRERLLELWSRAIREGVEAVGPETPAGHRLAETLSFFAFLQTEMPALLERWRAARPHR
jgi:DNA-binding transcriptional regulator GbsR (MarR family)